MSLRLICIEVRKNLHCANVFLQFDQNLTQTACLKINVEEDALRLRTEDAQPINILLAPYLTVEAYTMSNLTVEEWNASFRLTVTSLKELEFNAAQATGQQLKLNLEEKNCDATSIHCANCECALTEGAVEFQRIREFPSGAVDMSEFFCHNGPDFGAVLVPRMTDLFYGYQFVVFNAELLRTSTKEKDAHLYCRRCLQYLGETLFEGRATKLWTDTLRLKNKTTADKIVDIFSNSGDAISPSYALLNKVISDCAIAVQPSTPLLQFTKVLLEASFPNRQQRFILLHILEKQLPVLRNVQAQQVANQKDTQQLELIACKCIKLLFRQIQLVPSDDSSEDNSKEMLTTWQRDMSIQTLKISPTLFSALLAELESNTLLLPELYRYTRDEFQLSYVF